MTVHPIVSERKLEALRHALGADILTALTDPLVVEVLVNPDGRLVLDCVGTGRADTGLQLEPEARERVIRLIADYVGDPVTHENPRLAGVLPVTGDGSFGQRGRFLMDTGDRGGRRERGRAAEPIG